MMSHPMVFIQKNRLYKFKITKKYLQRESTKSVPCKYHTTEACNEIENYRNIIDKHSCHVPILYSGDHLNEIIENNKDLKSCNESITQEIMNSYMKDQPCESYPPCVTTRYTYNVQDYGNGSAGDKTAIKVLFQNLEVESQFTYVNYDIQSLIGEIGGTLGLTLGASVFTLTELISKSIKFCWCNKSK